MIEKSVRAPPTVRTSQAKELLGIGHAKLYKLTAAGEIETVKLGRSRLVIYASLVSLSD